MRQTQALEQSLALTLAATNTCSSRFISEQDCASGECVFSGGTPPVRDTPSPGLPSEFVVGQPAAKLSVSVPGELAEAVRKRVGAKGLSGFVARALAHELEREGIGALLNELEEQLGAPSKADLARARKAWPRR